jgi:hypothetical protein
MKKLAEAIAQCVYRHDFARAQHLLDASKKETLDIKIARIYLLATRSTAQDIEEGLQITNKKPINDEIRRWHPVFWLQKLKLYLLEGSSVDLVTNNTIKAYRQLERFVKNPKEKLRWQFAAAAVKRRRLTAIKEAAMFSEIKKLKRTRTSQELTVFADYALALNDKNLAAKLLQLHPYTKAFDGEKTKWKREAPTLTPYNRRGFLLQILVNEKVPEARLRSKFQRTKKLGALNELRTFTVGLLQLPLAQAQKLGKSFARQITKSSLR